MASKSQTFEIVLTANGSAVTEVMDELKNLAKGYAAELDKLTAKKEQGIALTKEEEAHAESLTKKIQGLNTAWERNAIELRQVDEIMKNLAGATGNEMGRALKTLSARFKRAKSDAVDDLIKIKEQIQAVRHEMSKREGVDALKKAKATLTDLANTPLDKLKMGLESIEKKLATMSEAEKQAAEGLELLEGKRRYQAQIAVTEQGRAGIAPISGMNADQLRAEQQRLRQGYLATEGVKGYEAISQEYLTRLQKVNQEIKNITEAERRQAQAARELEQAEQRRIEFARQGQQTHKTLANLEKASYEDMEVALKHLQEQYSRYATGDTKHIQRNLQAQDRLKQKMKEVQSMMLSDEEISKRVNNAKKYNLIELQQAYDQLKQKQMSLAAGEKTSLLEIRRQMQKLRTEIEGIQGQSSGLMKIWKTAVRNIATYVGVFAGFNMVKSKIQQVAKANLELSDSIAQVQKVTGLTRKEVDELNMSFAKIDTRTSLKDLNELAYSAGKMGLGKYGLDQVEGFVRATNQLQVALGDDLGNSVDEAITPLAKLAENLGLIQKMGVEKSMMAIGSSINELSQTTTAVGANIVDFARRVQPAAQMIGLSADQILALGSASDSFGVSSEISATAFTKFLAAYRTNTAEIEKILDMVPGTLDKFFEEGRTMEGLLAIFQRMHDIGDLRYLEEAFKALGSEGSRMFTTFGAFAKNVDMFREHLATSTQAFAEATSVTREYELVQNTAAGILERANNIWEKAFVNPQGVDTIKELALEWYKFSQELTQSETFMWGATNALKSLAGIVELLITMLPILIRSMYFYGVAAGIRKLVVEWNLMKIAMDGVATTGGKIAAFFKSNIWVLAATVIGYAVTYLYDYCTAQKKVVEANDESAKSMESARQANDTYNQTLSSNYANLMSKYDRLKREWKSLKTEHEKNEWIKKNKTAFDELGLSINSAATAEDIFNKNTANVIEGFKRRAEAAALAAKMTQLYNQQMDLETEGAAELKKRGKNAGDKVIANPSGVYTKDAGADTYNQGQYRYDASSGNYVYTDLGALEYNRRILHGIQKEYDGINKQIDETADRMAKLGKEPIVGQTTPTGGGGTGGSTNKELNAEMRDEQIKAKALIDNIKNYYQRQINALNELANDTNMSEGDLKGRLDRLQEHMNNALANARKAIGGEKNDWEDFKAKMREDLYEQTDEEGYNFSENLLNYIMDNQLDELRDMILKLSETLNKRGDVLLDQILRKATEDESKNIKQVTDQRKLLEKELLEMNYTGKVDRDSMSTMENLGLGSLTDVQTTQLQVWKQTGDTAAAKEFFKNREQMWYQMYAEAREHIAEIINTPIEEEGDEKKLLAILFGENYEETLQGGELEGFLNMSLEKWQVFYQKLLNYNDQWNDAQRKFYEDNKKRQDYLFNNNATTIEIKDGVTQMEARSAEMKGTGKDKGTNFAQLAGFYNPSDDPELIRLMLLEEQATRYYEKMEELRQQDLVSQEMVNDAKASLAEAEKNRQQELISIMEEQISKLQQWSEPFEQFGQDVGDAMGKALFESESMAEGMKAALKSLVKAWGQSTIDIVKQLMMQQLKQKMIDKAMGKEAKASQKEQSEVVEQGSEERFNVVSVIETGITKVVEQAGQERVAAKGAQENTETQQTAHKTIFDVLAGIAQGAAKTIGSLGPWGMALVAVISALLMGLLSTALGALGGGDKSSNDSSSKKKIKLASGMLTYDEGNVQTVVGDDGHVYRAREQASLPEGVKMITSPIATHVNGQQALVGERGPEIVIGRKTTRAIQMNRPDLLRDLALIDRGLTTRKVRTFDDGNIQDLASAIRPADGQQTAAIQQTDLTSEDARALTAAIGVFSQTVATLQKNGIPAKIQKYGKGGLIDEVQSGLKFQKRYEG